MTLPQLMKVRANGSVNWRSPDGPAGSDWYETYIGLSPIPHDHPPSLKNPQEVSIPTAQDGWKKGDSKAARTRALNDLVEIHKRLRRQIGKPTISQTAIYPMFPNIMDKT